MKYRLILTFKWVITIILLIPATISLMIMVPIIGLEGLVRFILWFPIWLFLGINIFTMSWFITKLMDYIIILCEKLDNYIWKNEKISSKKDEPLEIELDKPNIL